MYDMNACGHVCVHSQIKSINSKSLSSTNPRGGSRNHAPFTREKFYATPSKRWPHPLRSHSLMQIMHGSSRIAAKNAQTANIWTNISRNGRFKHSLCTYNSMSAVSEIERKLTESVDH